MEFPSRVQHAVYIYVYMIGDICLGLFWSYIDDSYRGLRVDGKYQKVVYMDPGSPSKRYLGGCAIYSETTVNASGRLS